MNKLFLITFLLFPIISQAQVEWTDFSIHIKSSNLEEKKVCINFPTNQTFDLIEFDRLVEGIVTVKVNEQTLIVHNGESIDAIQSYLIIFQTNQVCLEVVTNDDFWIRFQIAK